MIVSRVDVELGTTANVGWRFIPLAKVQAGFEAQARAMAAK